ncbi:D-alanyl-D-alanine carboxypeptidase [Streptomyces viridochromogenes]|nr:serine hydrolase [Streptomyces viridochromogenes]KOG14898.1 D-alanyl-D-alanine carboxypeptidase [Streptomyces viridochromogenes]KOG15092.1 D-alanyl-D-alanine carboxypeptidase [Streptomyces viridochromogenes]
MAGESPDRSKQRESSAEPTSGSAVPVPESRPDPDTPTRADAPERPDPRLAVTRDAARRGGVDTATRVLSRQELDAVRAKTEKPEDADAGDTEDAEAPESPEAEVTEDTSAEAAEAENAEAPEDAKAEADAEDAEGAAESAEGAESAESAEGKDDDRLKAAVAAWVASGDADGADEDAEGSEGAEEGAQDADARDEDVTDADETDDAPAAADGEDAPQGPPAPDNESRTGGTGGNTETEGEAEDADADDDAPAAAEDADDDAPAAADGEDAPQGPPAPDNESRTGSAGGNTETEGEAEGADDDAPASAPAAPGEAKAVDQPTAVFKAVRPADPPVDQPTTMLKAPKPDAETPSERTSKFVALKPDIKPDIKPDTPKPPTAPDVTAAVPQVGPERTTQQPLPPRPPLDLLAELTNTPPPPDTPVRTALRRVKIWTPLVLLLAIVFAVVQSMRPLPAPTLDLTAEDSYTFDGSKVDIPWPAQGQAALDVDGIGTFGSSGDQKPVPIASVAKVMTAYVILREHRLDSGAVGPKIEIDQAAEDQSDAGQESTVNVTKGDKITQREALESILIASANNVARLLARWDAGSEKAFVAKMNATAEDLGMANTTYTDPSGLNNTTVSTAVDQVKLAKAAMKEPAFREVAAMMSYDDYKGHNHGNWNQLVGKNNVVGIKTGTTTSALGNLVFAAKKEIGGETRTVVGAVVRQPDAGGGILAAALDSGDQLIRAAQDALESATILKKGAVVGYVDDGLGGRTPVVATKDVKAVGWSGLKVKLTFAPDEVPHTAKAGTKVGTLTVGDGSSGAVKIPVALKADLAEPGFTDKLTRVG